MNTQARSRCPARAVALSLLLFLGGACGGLPTDVTEPAGADDSNVPSQDDLTLPNQPGSTSPFVYDGGTTCAHIFGTSGNFAHCCPSGMAMTGAHLNNNVFKCAPVQGGFVSFSQDANPGGTQRNNMHACPFGSVMVGFFRGGVTSCGIFSPCKTTNEILICGKVASGVAFEYVDATTQDRYPMHVCREDVSNPFRYAMSGIHDAGNRFTCAR